VFNKTIPRQWVKRILLTLTGLFALALILSVVAFVVLSRGLPAPERIQTIEQPLKTLVFAADGDTLREFYRENRTVLPLERFPLSLQRALIATEDRQFFEHYGLDLRRLPKIIWNNLTTGTVHGGSTLTQQLARNLFLNFEKTYVRKAKEALLTLQLEQTYTKDEILAMYLNEIWLGYDAYGFQAGAQLYYGKNVWELEPHEAAMLAGIVQSPAYYSPFSHLDRAYQRRVAVLRSLMACGHLTRAEAETLGRREVQIVDREARRPDRLFAAYFIEEVRKEIEARYGAEGLYSRGLRVYTTLMPRYQRWLEEAAETHMVQEEALLRNAPLSRADYDSLVQAGQRPARVEYLQCAGLLQDVRTGAVLALMGGRSFRDYKWNIAFQAPRQPGSVFKPLVYLTALQHGYNAATILMDTPFVYDTGVSLWRPRNFSGKFEGPVSLRYALSRSINSPTAKLFLDFGLNPVLENARRLGITSELPRVPSVFLGAGELKLREIVPAYATFANHGVWVQPHLITRVESNDGEILEEARIIQHEVLDPALAYLMTDLLQTTLAEGTGKNARWFGFQQTGGGKTGTTNDETNAWFCGFTPSYCAGIWVGFDRPIPMGYNRTGARMALPIWARFMGRVTAEKGDEPFVVPPGIESRTICAHSGLLARSSCDSLRAEVFLPDNMPVNLCDRHGGQIIDFSGQGKDFQSLDRAGENRR